MTNALFAYVLSCTPHHFSAECM